MATVPNVVGLTQTAALAAIAAAGLTAALQPSYSSTVSSGTVISQNPTSGTSLPPGGDVIVAVSAGVAPVAGNGYDQWGAGGGGVTAVSAPVPLGTNLATGAAPDNAVYGSGFSVLAALANGNIPLSQATPAYQVPTTPKVG